MEKIYITGTGRAGTTFLIKIFTFLEFDTGYTKENYQNYIHSNCGSGMEKDYLANNYIIKNPIFMKIIPKIATDKNIKIKTMIIPIRDYKSSAISRLSNGMAAGGLWDANDEISQISFYNKIMADYLYYMTIYDINTIFLDFNRMTKDKMYLFDKLKNILDEKKITFEMFSSAYDKASPPAKPPANTPAKPPAKPPANTPAKPPANTPAKPPANIPAKPPAKITDKK
jgi:hypothetical protein